MDLEATRGVSTALVIEPDPGLQRKLVRNLTALGYRVVPVAGADQGLDLAQRFHFDLLLCAKSLPGLQCVEFSDHLRKLSDAVILIDATDDTFEAQLAGTGPRNQATPGLELEEAHP